MFIQQNLTLSSSPSKFAFNHYIYKTEDTCAEVLTPGYFDASRFAFTNPVEWKNAIIEVKCADGFGKGFIDNLGDFQFFIGGLPDAFCDWIDYVAQEIGGGGSSFVRNAIDKQYEVTTIGGGFNGFNFANQTDGFNSTVSSSSYEVEVISAGDPVSGGAVFFVQLPVAPQDPPIIVAGFFNQAGNLVDAVAGAPIGSAAFQTGYTMGITFNFSNDTVLASDNDSLANYSLAVEPAYDDSLDIFQGWIGASLNATTNIFSPNSGDRPFVLPQSTGVGFCNVVPVPPPQLCVPVSLVLNEGVPPNNQTMILSGVNNLTVEATSLGNVVTDGGGAGATEFFQTATEEVKIEHTMLKDTTTVGVSQPPICGLSFLKDLFTPTPTLLASVAYLPETAGGAIFDVAGGTILTTGVGKILFNQALYLDPTPQQKKYAFQVNTGIAGDITVHGVTSPVSALDQQEDIASVIVSNGFTDPTIESLTISPSDSRTVIITYTVASGDAVVDISTTNGITWYEDTSASQAYQIAQVRTKFEEVGNPPIVEYNQLAIAPVYSNLDNIYMTSILNAGDGLGGELDVTVNYGSSGFLLGEDAERWCNV